jgi:hypothetical protein
MSKQQNSRLTNNNDNNKLNNSSEKLKSSNNNLLSSQNISLFFPSLKQTIKTTIDQLNLNNNKSLQYYSSSTPPPLPSSSLPTSSSSSLSSSPSLTSLQNSLYFAIENPDKHSIEQLRELERHRIQVKFYF